MREFKTLTPDKGELSLHILNRPDRKKGRPLVVVNSEAIAERDRGDIGAVRRRLKATKDKLERYGCAESTGQAIENLRVFEETSEEWGPRARKLSRQFSSRSTKTSSYYEAEPLDDQSGKQPPQAPASPDKPEDQTNPPNAGEQPPTP